MVVDKPAGLATVGGGWEPGQASLIEQLRSEHGPLWAVHRLDRVTSGVVVFARTAEVQRALSMLFESRAVTKAYHALVHGEPAWEQHTARHPLHADVGHSHRTAVDPRRGKPSETGFRVLERFGEACLLEALPHTGRTHQVRAHAAALGYPLLGDGLYGAPPTERIGRPALHAVRLAFVLEDEEFEFIAPHPDDFREALETLRAGP